MTERALIRRELVRQTALLFFVFALLFALLGAGVYSMVSSNIYRNADENLQAIGMESDYITLDAAGSGSAIVDDVVVEEPDGAAPSDATAIDDLSLTLQQSIVDADPQFITLIRNEQGDLLETVGLYASYPSFLRHIPFDKNDLERVYQIAAGGHEYRGITYAANDEGETTYLQTLVNVDHSRRLHAHVDCLLGGSRRRGSGRKLLAFAAHAQAHRGEHARADGIRAERLARAAHAARRDPDHRRAAAGQPQ